MVLTGERLLLLVKNIPFSRKNVKKERKNFITLCKKRVNGNELESLEKRSYGIYCKLKYMVLLELNVHWCKLPT